MTHDPTAVSLCGSWVHSHEEDADGLEVYRPAGYPFPPARGRSSLTLEPDGRASTGAPGPVDRGTSAPARWELTGTELTVEPLAPPAGGAARYDVVSVDEQRLTLRPAR